MIQSDNKEEFKNDIDRIYNKYDVDYTTILMALHSKCVEEENQRIRKTCESHKDMIGKCFIEKIKPELFPEMLRFYKVISNQSSNECFLECLIFDEHPTYWFDYQAEPAVGSWYLGNFDFESFHTEDVFISDLEKMREIGIDQYNQAMMDYTKELVNLPWYAEHYRYGNKWPTDPEWKKDEK